MLLFDADIVNTTIIDGNTAYRIYMVVDYIQNIPHRIDVNGKYWILKANGTDNIHLPLTLFEVDPLTENSIIRADLKSSINKQDIIGDPKYYMFDNAGTWELYDKDGWEEVNIYG